MSDTIKTLIAIIKSILVLQRSSVSGRVRFNRTKRKISDLYEFCLETEFDDTDAKAAEGLLDELAGKMNSGQRFQVSRCIDELQSFQL
jgi:hypothetical protein